MGNVLNGFRGCFRACFDDFNIFFGLFIICICVVYGMSSGIDKEWMKDKNLESGAYKDGMINFLTFVQENVSGNKHSCPCKHCRNGSGQIDVGDIFIHLMEYGIDEEYNFWCFHGETSGVTLVNQPQLEAISNTP